MGRAVKAVSDAEHKAEKAKPESSSESVVATVIHANGNKAVVVEGHRVRPQRSFALRFMAPRGGVCAKGTLGHRAGVASQLTGPSRLTAGGSRAHNKKRGLIEAPLCLSRKPA
uniref:Uncharacterized protein n=1 Tax=uncultured prokaryote TaxID=198431 RepID=H5SKV1_9ZZZZ|nr:hypothetical protein HGMM_F42G09C13 [uncultured prokaryote]